MNLIKKLFAGSAFVAAVASSHATIIHPNTSGGSELFVVLYTANNQNSLIVDLGVTLSNFNWDNMGYRFPWNAISVEQVTKFAEYSFNLASSPYYSTFIENNAGVSTVQFAVIGANQFGSTKQLWVTGAENTTPVNLTNRQLATRTSAMNNFVGAVNTGVDTASYTNGHSVTNGSSLDTGSNATSFSALSGNLTSALTMVDAGQSAELFSYVTSSSNNNANSTLTDFYSTYEVKYFFGGPETPGNPGGYFTMNITTGSLDYYGNPPEAIPEASEWAMMLSGLGVLGLMVRRRKNSQFSKPSN